MGFAEVFEPIQYCQTVVREIFRDRLNPATKWRRRPFLGPSGANLHRLRKIILIIFTFKRKHIDNILNSKLKTYLKMLSLAYVMDCPSQLTLVGDQGKEGIIQVNLVPTDEVFFICHYMLSVINYLFILITTILIKVWSQKPGRSLWWGRIDHWGSLRFSRTQISL